MACPYFLPTQKLEDGGWLHASRLPLGTGWSGQCSATSQAGCVPTTDELRQFCNLGYADGCTRLPSDRTCDAVRFSVARCNALHLTLTYVREKSHRPVSCGTLEYDRVRQAWTQPHPEHSILQMADCYVQVYLERQLIRSAGVQ